MPLASRSTSLILGVIASSSRHAHSALAPAQQVAYVAPKDEAAFFHVSQRHHQRVEPHSSKETLQYVPERQGLLCFAFLAVHLAPKAPVLYAVELQVLSLFNPTATVDEEECCSCCVLHCSLCCRRDRIRLDAGDRPEGQGGAPARGTSFVDVPQTLGALGACIWSASASRSSR
jgi:hypothetical protein